MILVYLGLFWLAGIVVGSVWHVEAEPLLAMALLPAAVSVLWRRQALIRGLALCALAVLAGMLRYQAWVPDPDYGTIALHIGPRSVEVGGVVVAEPDVRDRDMRLVVSTYHIGSGRDSFPVSGAVQVRVPRFSDYRYGDNLLLKGHLTEPPEYDTFSYKDYLARQGIQAIMYYPYVEVLGRDQGNRLLAALYSAKSRLQHAIIAYIPEPQAGLVQGVLLGVKAVISDDLREDLAATGLTHIVVVSGYNLTVIATVLQRLTERRLRRELGLVLALVGVVLFTLMTGASPPVVRAAIMVSLALAARAAGREADALNSLALTGVAMTAINPILLWDVSFQLSFLATAGLVILAPPLEGALKRLPWGVGTVLATTLAAQIMTLPVIALNFQRISLISPLANLFVQPAIPGLMGAGALVAIAGLTGHAAVQALGWLAWLLGVYVVDTIRLFGSLPLAAVDLPYLPADTQMAAIVTYFAAVMLVFFVPQYVHLPDMRAAGQRMRAGLQRLSMKAVLAVLAGAAIIVWLAVLLLVRATE